MEPLTMDREVMHLRDSLIQTGFVQTMKGTGVWQWYR